jgi:hypothetical protein
VSASGVVSDPQREQTWDEGHYGDHYNNPHHGTRKSDQTRLGSEEET